MSSICLLVLCGVPGAGKSTWAQNFISFIRSLKGNSDDMKMTKCQENNSEMKDFEVEGDTEPTRNQYEVIHIAYDGLIDEELEAELIADSKNCSREINNSGWKLCRKVITSFVDQMIDEMSSFQSEFPRQNHSPTNADSAVLDKNSLDFTPQMKKLRIAFDEIVRQQMNRESDSKHCIVIIDDNMYYSSMRYEYFQIARKHETGFAVLCFPVELSVALHRNRMRKRRVEESVIVDMFEKLEMPSSENSWEKYTAMWNHTDSGSDSFLEILSLIEDALKNPVRQIAEDTESEESRIICSTNTVHQADIMLRKILGQHLKDVKDSVKSKAECAQVAASCNSIRLQILEELKSEVLLVPTFARTEPDITSASTENQFFGFLKELFSKKLTTVIT